MLTPLSPSQAKILESGILHSGYSCILQMPTGSGKTWLAEQAIARVLDQGGRAIYLSPLRALASELASRWRKSLDSTSVGVFTGDFGTPGSPYPVSFEQARLLVMTPERLDSCTRTWRAHWSWLPQVDLVVVDECHLLGDPHRGARLEGTLSRMRRLNPFVRFLCLSATLGNRTELADWLGALEYASHWRPIPLEWRIVTYRKAAEKPDLLVQEVRNTTETGGKSLVFVHSRRRAEQLTHLLCAAGLRAHHHHAGLSHDERQIIERDFRGDEIGAVVATSTLEMGLNLPVWQVLLYDLQVFDGSDFVPLSTSTVWQRAGRAGRVGLDDRGEAVLFAPSWDHAVSRYQEGEFEPIRSGLTRPAALAEQIVAEVASGLCSNSWHLQTVFQQSLASHQQSLPYLGTIVADMCNAGMLREDGTGTDLRLRATRLGHITVRHLLAPATIILFARVLERGTSLTLFDLLLLCASSLDCEPILMVDFEELDMLNEELSRESSELLSMPHRDLVRALSIDGKRLLSALKMALVIRMWIRTSDAQYVADLHDCYRFEVQRLRESVERLLLAMAAVRERPRKTEVPQETPPELRILHEWIRMLHTMVAAGIDEYAATLARVDGIGPVLARRLQDAGITDLQQLAVCSPSDLTRLPGISRRRAASWIVQAQELAQSASLPSPKAPIPAPALRNPNVENVDPYRLRRARDLKVHGPDGDTYRVTGGLEPHRVRLVGRAFHCDCHDADEGHICKHVLAIRLHRGDRQLRRRAKELAAGPTSHDAPLNLFDLWYSDNTAQPGRRTTWHRERSAPPAERSGSRPTSRSQPSATSTPSMI